MTVAMFFLGCCIGSALTFVWVGICERNDQIDRPFIDPKGEG